MCRYPPQRAALAVLLCVLLIAPGLAAPQDAAGSRDPLGVPRYPRSWIVSYERDGEARPREFVMSRVDRIRRDLRVEERLRVDATFEGVTYEMPEGTGVGDVMSHYLEQLGGDVLFRCEGRGCGRSADWANQIFEQAILYGPDRNQRYAALERDGHLVAVYVVERGNQRVYAHLRVLQPEGDLGLEPNALLARRLAERGWAEIEGVTPARDGSIPAPGAAVLDGLAADLEDFEGESLQLVCHLYGRDAPAELLAASRRCAAAAAERVSAGGRVRAEPFGAGPFLPRTVPPRARLELVLPGGPRTAP